MKRFTHARIFFTCLAFPVLIAQPVLSGAVVSKQVSTMQVSTMQVSTIPRQAPIFIENQGQWDSRAKFFSSLPGASVWLTAGSAQFELIRRTEQPEQLPASYAEFSQFSGKSGAEAVVSSDPLSSVPLSSVPLSSVPLLSESTERLVVSARFEGANPSVRIRGEGLLPATFNYFKGSDPDGWRANVRAYSSVVYEDFYSGIDLRYFQNGKNLEYEFIAAPGADLSQIKIRYEGVESLSVSASGDLIVSVAGGEVLRELSPTLSQTGTGGALMMEGKFVLSANNTFTIQAPASYDESRAITIDPVVSISTEFGGSGLDRGEDIVVDAAGDLYVVGTTESVDFPATTGSFSSFVGGVSDAFLSKFSGVDHSLIYSSILGGDSSNFTRNEIYGLDKGLNLALGQDGSLYLTGYTYSNDFPVTPGAYLSSLSVADNSSFASKLSANGDQLLYSTYMYGADESDYGIYDITVDDAGLAYLVGATYAPDKFPLVNPLNVSPPPTTSGTSDMIVMKLNAAGSNLLYSTLLGGSYGDLARQVGIDPLGQIVVTGTSWSSDFPLVDEIEGYNADPSGVPWSDVTIVRISPDGSNLVFSTYLGGTNSDPERAATLAPDGSIYVTGGTESSDFNLVNPINGTFPSFWAQSFHGGFVAKISPAGTLEYSTYHDGGGTAIAVDAAGNTYVAGWFDGDFSKLAQDGSCLIRKDVNVAFANAMALESDGTAHLLSNDPYSGMVTITSVAPSPDYVCGDADNSCKANIGDVTFLISRIFSGGPAPVNPDAGDADGSGSVNVGDVTSMIAYIFSGGAAPLCGTTGF